MRLGISWAEAGSVVVSTVGIYVAFLLLIRLAGQRALSSLSSFDFAAAVAFGSVVGRVILGYTPTLVAGVLGLVMLFGLQAGFSLVRRSPRADAALSNLPLLLMADGHVLDGNLRKAHMVENELREKLRLAGVRRYDDVACVILERTGAVSVLRRGETISPQLLADVRGLDQLPPHTVQT